MTPPTSGKRRLLLPKQANIAKLLEGMAENGLFDEGWEHLTLKAPKDCFINPGSLAFLTSWCLHRQQEGRTVTVEGRKKPLSYLARMDFQKILQVPFEEQTRLPEAGRFLPVQLIEEGVGDVTSAVNQICDLVLQQFDNSREFLPALEWAINEIIDNIDIHAEASVAGAVHAQLYPKVRRLEIGIADQGIGIYRSLNEGAEGHRPASHVDAIGAALQRGVSRDRSIGQGNGMAGCLEILKRNRGGLQVWSGDALYEIAQGDNGSSVKIPPVAGTGVQLTFELRHGVDLGDTWIGQPTYTYIEHEAERVGKAGLVVATQCSHTGARAPARRLRRKVLTLLPDMAGVLAIDFTGIETASSSFLDELLGRLFEELGAGEFDRQIELHSMNPTIRDMANVVIGQRLHSKSDSSPQEVARRNSEGENS